MRVAENGRGLRQGQLVDLIVDEDPAKSVLVRGEARGNRVLSKGQAAIGVRAFVRT
jgi:hypothetical protein